MRLDGLELLCSGSALIPRLERDHEESVVAGANKTQQTETDDAGRIFHSRRAGENVFDLCRGLRCSLERSAVGQLHVHIQETLILIGKKTRRHGLAKNPGGRLKPKRS